MLRKRKTNHLRHSKNQIKRNTIRMVLRKYELNKHGSKSDITTRLLDFFYRQVNLSMEYHYICVILTVIFTVINVFAKLYQALDNTTAI